MDIEPGNTALEVLEWIGIVFAAGFVGYFGRYLGKLLIQRMNRKRKPPPDTSDKTTAAIEKPTEHDDKDFKLEKKRLKLEKKRAKKLE